MFVLEFDIGIIHVVRILIKILNKTSACAVLFLPSVDLVPIDIFKLGGEIVNMRFVD